MTTITASVAVYRSCLTNCLILIATALSLINCGGGGGGGGTSSVSDPNRVGSGWVTITFPVSVATYSTDSLGVVLAGEAFISPTWWRCCSGNATDTAVTVTWTNATTGQSDLATQSLSYICIGGCYPGTHRWQSNIDLALGDNLLTVTASDPSGNLGRATITVTRTPDITPPTVMSTVPANGATGVGTNSALAILFSEPMDSTTLSPFTIVLKDSSNNTMSGSVSYAGNVATYTPAGNLLGAYTAAVTTGAKDVGGNALAAAYVWTFTTGPAPDLTPPTVSSTAPANGATCVPTEAAITASFSEAIPPSAMSTSTFLLRDAQNNAVNGTAALDYLGVGNFLPTNPLANSSVYTGTITTGLADLAGNHLLVDYSWSFTTQAAGNGMWSSTSNTGAPSPRTGHAAVWTGTQMIVWGGEVGDGARYDPLTDGWSPISNIGAPESRTGHLAVWTGSRMIVWGGVRPGAFLNSGAIYDPVADSWSPMSSSGAPSPRQRPVYVWTGSELLVWGGADAAYLGDGARYNPSTNTWLPISASGAPSPRSGATAVWTGSAMLVWGGSDFNTGAMYTPSSDSWTAIPLTNAPMGRRSHIAVWTGAEMIIWGGSQGMNANPLDTGARFNPSSSSWQPMTILCGPLARYGHVGVWNGTELLVWGGGQGNGPHYSAGGRYNPGTDTWQPIPIIGMPGGRMGHTGIWDGSRLIVWGGRDVLGTLFDSGGRYQPQ